MKDTLICAACGNHRSSSAMQPGNFVPDNVIEQIQKKHPGWTADQRVCDNCVSEGKADLAEEMLQEEMSDLSPLEEEVVESIRTDTIVAVNENTIVENPATEQGLAHRITEIIGNWYFPLTIAIMLFGWLVVNIFLRPFSPYPMIMLGVISAFLASLAALYGPIIIMSQRDQQQRDRQRADNEYRINLKAELEIRYLDDKVKKMMFMQQKVLSELQEKQSED